MKIPALPPSPPPACAIQMAAPAVTPAGAGTKSFETILKSKGEKTKAAESEEKHNEPPTAKSPETCVVQPVPVTPPAVIMTQVNPVILGEDHSTPENALGMASPESPGESQPVAVLAKKPGSAADPVTAAGDAAAGTVCQVAANPANRVEQQAAAISTQAAALSPAALQSKPVTNPTTGIPAAAKGQETTTNTQPGPAIIEEIPFDPSPMAPAKALQPPIPDNLSLDVKTTKIEVSSNLTLQTSAKAPQLPQLANTSQGGKTPISEPNHAAPVKIQPEPAAVGPSAGTTGKSTSPNDQPGNNPAAKTLQSVNLPVENQASITAANGPGNLAAPPTLVTEPARLAEAHQTDIINQISKQVEQMAQKNQSMLHLQLYPEKMGRIDLRLVSSSHGLNVTLTADQPTTCRMLENQLDQLKSSLIQAGLQLTHLDVGQHGGQPTASWQNPLPARSNPLSIKPTQGKEVSSDINPQPSGVNVSLTGIDYRI